LNQVVYQTKLSTVLAQQVRQNIIAFWKKTNFSLPHVM
jgi:hypothetical protein